MSEHADGIGGLAPAEAERTPALLVAVDTAVPVAEASGPNSAAPAPAAANPCLTCGACCAYYRASFYWAEGDDATPGGVPVELTEKLDAFQRVMRGTNQHHPRCVALRGEIGVSVWCAIYDRRSSVCREFQPSWLNGEPNERCDRARHAHGLAPLNPSEWDSPRDLPRAA